MVLALPVAERMRLEQHDEQEVTDDVALQRFWGWITGDGRFDVNPSIHGDDYAAALKGLDPDQVEAVVDDLLRTPDETPV